MFDDCQRIGPGPLQIVAITCIARCTGRRMGVPFPSCAKPRKQREAGNRRRIRSDLPRLVVFATLLPVIASLILPPCFRMNAVSPALQRWRCPPPRLPMATEMRRAYRAGRSIPG